MQPSRRLISANDTARFAQKRLFAECQKCDLAAPAVELRAQSVRRIIRTTLHAGGAWKKGFCYPASPCSLSRSFIPPLAFAAFPMSRNIKSKRAWRAANFRVCAGSHLTLMPGRSLNASTTKSAIFLLFTVGFLIRAYTF